jgi:hypothetical protein
MYVFMYVYIYVYIYMPDANKAPWFLVSNSTAPRLPAGLRLRSSRGSRASWSAATAPRELGDAAARELRLSAAAAAGAGGRGDGLRELNSVLCSCGGPRGDGLRELNSVRCSCGRSGGGDEFARVLRGAPGEGLREVKSVLCSRRLDLSSSRGEVRRIRALADASSVANSSSRGERELNSVRCARLLCAAAVLRLANWVLLLPLAASCCLLSSCSIAIWRVRACVSSRLYIRTHICCCRLPLAAAC